MSKRCQVFMFGPRCGEHCGQARAGKVRHCDTCHALTVAKAQPQQNQERNRWA